METINITYHQERGWTVTWNDKGLTFATFTRKNLMEEYITLKWGKRALNKLASKIEEIVKNCCVGV